MRGSVSPPSDSTGFPVSRVRLERLERLERVELPTGSPLGGGKLGPAEVSLDPEREREDRLEPELERERLERERRVLLPDEAPWRERLEWCCE